jgi:hypothetical protein
MTSMPTIKVSRGKAISKRELHLVLRDWLDGTEERIIGDESLQGRTPWIYIRESSQLFKLHSDTNRLGVQSYLEQLKSGGDDILWTIVKNQRGKMNAVAFGQGLFRVNGFYLYLCD